MKEKTRFLKSQDGVKIHLYKWTPEKQPVAVLQILHGMAEHAARYRDFAKKMTDNGFVVVAAEHRGHGKSIEKFKGHFADKNGWNLVLGDVKMVASWINSEYGELPFFQFGHSMGSVLLRNYLFLPDGIKPKAAVFSGMVYSSTIELFAGNILSKIIGLFNKTGHYSKLLSTLNFGKNNRRISSPKTTYDWLNRDEKEVQIYMENDLCGFHCSPQFYQDLSSGVMSVQSQKNIKKTNPDLPMLFLSGTADPVGGYGKANKIVSSWYEKAGNNNISVKDYPDARHELLLEINRDEVMTDILNWLSPFVKK